MRREREAWPGRATFGEWQRREWLLRAGGACAALLAGCKSGPPPPPPPTQVSGNLVGSEDLNPSITERPSPLRLRIYELKSPAAFNDADFMSLYQSDQAALAADLVSREEITLQPGETRPYSKKLAPETRWIGVVGLYRDLEHATWRVVVPVQVSRSQAIAIRAGRLAVSLAIQPR